MTTEHERMWLSTKEASAVSSEDVVSRLRVSYRTGLSWKECEFRRQMTGYNEFSVHQGDPLWKKYIEQVKQFKILDNINIVVKIIYIYIDFNRNLYNHIPSVVLWFI